MSWCDDSGATRTRRTGCVVELSALPMSHAMLSPGRWWQHHRFRRHLGGRLCPACGCARGGWCRRLRRGRRAKPVIGESEFRLAGSVVRRSLVFVAERPACWSATCVATRSMRREPTRCWTSLGDSSCEVAGARETLWGFRGASPEAFVLRCETSRHVLRSDGTGSLLSGRVGGDRVVAATSRQGSSRTSHQPYIPGCGSEVMALRFC